MSVPLSNRLLDKLPDKDRRSLLELLEPVPLRLGTIIYEAHEKARYVHFVTSGIVSLVTILGSGSVVEVGLSGREGFPEALQLLGPERGSKRAIVQVAGTALRMDFDRFRQEFQRNETLRNLVLRFVQYESLALSQIAACNRLHEIEERLARWLHMVYERTGDTTLTLTQDLIAQMLGARRASVTLAAGHLQKAGIIEYRRADIRILDLKRLREVSCECTAVIHDLFGNLYR